MEILERKILKRGLSEEEIKDMLYNESLKRQNQRVFSKITYTFGMMLFSWVLISTLLAGLAYTLFDFSAISPEVALISISFNAALGVITYIIGLVFEIKSEN